MPSAMASSATASAQAVMTMAVSRLLEIALAQRPVLAAHLLHCLHLVFYHILDNLALPALNRLQATLTPNLQQRLPALHIPMHSHTFC